MLATFFDFYLNRVIVIISLTVSGLYIAAMLASGVFDAGLILPKAVTFLTSAGALVTCLAGMIMMAAMSDAWLGNVQKFRLHLALGCLAGAVTAGLLLFNELWPVLRTFVAKFF
jgi:hypothetical protein